MLIHLARLSVITIALALVGTLGFLLARPSAPTVITVVVPQQPAVAAAPTTVIHQGWVPSYWPYCGARVCWR